MHSVFSVGLTGGVGSGKSTVASMLSESGAAVIDADVISHELTNADGAAVSALRASFGDQAIADDGSLDRDYMRARVFSSVSTRRQLESVLHPLIRSEMRERAAMRVAAGSPYVVFVVPLLVETGTWHAVIRRVLLVDCTEATQLARVRARPGLSKSLALKIIGAQANRRDRLTAANDVLMNELPLTEIGPKVQRLHRAYLQCAAAWRDAL